MIDVTSFRAVMFIIISMLSWMCNSLLLRCGVVGCFFFVAVVKFYFFSFLLLLRDFCGFCATLIICGTNSAYDVYEWNPVQNWVEKKITIPHTHTNAPKIRQMLNNNGWKKCNWIKFYSGISKKNVINIPLLDC